MVAERNSNGHSGGNGRSERHDGVRANSKKRPMVVTKASQLTLAENLAVLAEATELPPFGFNIAGLAKRLKRRLGFEIAQVCDFALLVFASSDPRSRFWETPLLQTE